MKLRVILGLILTLLLPPISAHSVEAPLQGVQLSNFCASDETDKVIIQSLRQLLEEHELATREPIHLIEVKGSEEFERLRTLSPSSDRELRILVQSNPVRLEGLSPVGLDSMRGVGTEITGILRGGESLMKDSARSNHCKILAAAILKTLSSLDSPTLLQESYRQLQSDPEILRYTAELSHYRTAGGDWVVLSPRQKAWAQWVGLTTLGFLILLLILMASYPRIGISRQGIHFFSPIHFLKPGLFIRKLTHPSPHASGRSPFKKALVSLEILDEIRRFELQTRRQVIFLIEESAPGVWLRKIPLLSEALAKELQSETQLDANRILILWASLKTREVRLILPKSPHPVLTHLMECLSEDLASTSAEHAIRLFLKTGAMILDSDTHKKGKVRK